MWERVVRESSLAQRDRARLEAAMALFVDRHDAGKALAGTLARFAGVPGVMVLGLARGGVVVGYEVARALGVPLDAFIVRKLGVPGHAELAMGAIASVGNGSVRVLNQEVVRGLGIDERTIEAVAAEETVEMVRREREYRGERAPADVLGKTVILVDDGLATGSTMRAAAVALRRLHPAKIVIAVPVGAAQTCRDIHDVADEVECANSAERFSGVGAWYEDFSETTDDEVRGLLEAGWKRAGAGD